MKVAKLLSSTKAPLFYPSIFICVTEILDTFGSLVYQRILAKANVDPTTGKRIKLREDFTADDVNVTAKETCRNWFYKTGE